jgi:hypothetical protein
LVASVRRAFVAEVDHRAIALAGPRFGAFREGAAETAALVRRRDDHAEDLGSFVPF